MSNKFEHPFGGTEFTRQELLEEWRKQVLEKAHIRRTPEQLERLKRTLFFEGPMTEELAASLGEAIRLRRQEPHA